MTTDRRNRSPPPTYDLTYTMLAATIDHIYQVTKDKAPFRRPPPLSFNAAKDKRRYCDYHESTGHNTHDCRQLKDEIESLIKDGYLMDWVKKHRVDHPPERRGLGSTQETDAANHCEEPRFVREGSIRSIFGGAYIGRGSRNSMERYAKEAKTRPLINVNHLSARPPKLFKGESMDITFIEEDAK